MVNRLTPSEWDQLFPNLPERTNESQLIADMGELFTDVDVITAVYSRERWPGIAEIGEEDADEEILFRAGRWLLTNNGVVCLGIGYQIASDRLNEEDWIAQLSEKTWLYDPSDLLDAYEAARERLLPDESTEDRNMMLNRQIQLALERGGFPFNTSNVLGRYVYLPARMDNEERRAFCESLSAKGYEPTF